MVTGEKATSTPDDFALMRAIAMRDASALAALYDRYAAVLFPVCLRIVRDWMDAQDVLTEVFWEVWNRADRFNAMRGTPRSYLMTLTRSRAIDRRRAMGRRQHAPLAENAGEQHVSSTTDAPLRDAMTAELGERIRSALDSLDEPQRQVLELSLFDHLSHTEIAVQTGKPLGTVKTHIRLGLIRLRDFLRREEGSPS